MPVTGTGMTAQPRPMKSAEGASRRMRGPYRACLKRRVGSRHEEKRGHPLHYITASFCNSTSLAVPLRACASNASNSASLNGVFSAVP